jgi:hypothetical protein
MFDPLASQGAINRLLFITNNKKQTADGQIGPSLLIRILRKSGTNIS